MILRVGFFFLILTAVTSSSSIAETKVRSAREAYDRQMRLLEQVFETGSQDEAKLRSLYTRDAVLVEATGNEIRGRDQIVAAFRKVLASGAVVHFRVKTTSFRSSGNLSYAGGFEDIDERDGSALRHGRNRFVVVMRHEEDGDWRMDYVLEART